MRLRVSLKIAQWKARWADRELEVAVRVARVVRAGAKAGIARMVARSAFCRRSSTLVRATKLGRVLPAPLVSGCVAEVVVEVALCVPDFVRGRIDRRTFQRRLLVIFASTVTGAAAGFAVGLALASAPPLVEALLVALAGAAAAYLAERALERLLLPPTGRALPLPLPAAVLSPAS